MIFFSFHKILVLNFQNVEEFLRNKNFLVTSIIEVLVWNFYRVYTAKRPTICQNFYMSDPCRDWGQNIMSLPGSRFKSAITLWKRKQNRNGPRASPMGSCMNWFKTKMEQNISWDCPFKTWLISQYFLNSKCL